MKNLYLITFMLCLSLFPQQLFSVGPNVLLLKNNKTEKVKVFQEGDSVEVFCSCGKYSVKGPIHLVSDSSISIKNDTFPLSTIDKISIQPTFTRITGEVFVSVGVLFIVGGIIEGSQPESFSEIPVGTYLTTGFGLTGTGLFLNWIRKSYSQKKWTYSIGVIPEKKQKKNKKSTP